MTAPVRVLVADDSPVCLAAVRDALTEGGRFEVLAEARDGARAVELTQRLRPDVVVMDVWMPRLDGLEAVERIMSTAPTPILVLTGDPTARDGPLAYEALRRGALDLVSKDDLRVSPRARAALRENVAFVASIPVIHHLTPRRRPPAPPRRAAPARCDLVALVASTGGPAALARVLSALPADLPTGLVIVQHMQPGFLPAMAAWLDGSSAIRVRMASDGEPILEGVALLAPDGVDTTVTASRRVRLQACVAGTGFCPSGDALLRSAARHAGPRALGIVLTGMGHDGAAGLRELRRVGGATIVQDEATSAVYGMPRAALALEPSHTSLPLDAIGAAIASGAPTWA